ncbi:MAG: hypothetical protein WBQ68_13670, partial [Terriglobales bacterium]
KPLTAKFAKKIRKERKKLSDLTGTKARVEDCEYGKIYAPDLPSRFRLPRSWLSATIEAPQN